MTNSIVAEISAGLFFYFLSLARSLSLCLGSVVWIYSIFTASIIGTLDTPCCFACCLCSASGRDGNTAKKKETHVAPAVAVAVAHACIPRHTTLPPGAASCCRPISCIAFDVRQGKERAGKGDSVTAFLRCTSRAFDCLNKFSSW